MLGKKIAVCFSGQTRTFDKTCDSIFQSFSGLDVDYFFSTWHSSCENNEQLLSTFSARGINLKSFEFITEPNFLVHEKNIAKSYLESFPDFYILNQWYGVERAISLVTDIEEIECFKYDVIIRCRFDLLTNFSFSDVASLSKEDCINIVPAGTGGSDQYIFGDRDLMVVLKGIRKWLCDFPNKYEGSFGFYASPLLRAYIYDNKLGVNFINGAPLVVLREKNSSKRSASALRVERIKLYVANFMPEFVDKLWAGDRYSYEAVTRNEQGEKIVFPWDAKFYNPPRRHFVSTFEKK